MLYLRRGNCSQYLTLAKKAVVLTKDGQVHCPEKSSSDILSPKFSKWILILKLGKRRPMASLFPDFTQKLVNHMFFGLSSTETIPQRQ
jgi:hypothetical protein